MCGSANRFRHKKRMLLLQSVATGDQNKQTLSATVLEFSLRIYRWELLRKFPRMIPMWNIFEIKLNLTCAQMNWIAPFFIYTLPWSLSACYQLELQWVLIAHRWRTCFLISSYLSSHIIEDREVSVCRALQETTGTFDYRQLKHTCHQNHRQ